MPLAVLVNVRAGHVRRDPDCLPRIRALAGAGRVEATRESGEIEPALERLRDAGADPFAVVGGDGSVTAALTALVRVWPRDSLPRVLLAGGGTINTIARSLGARGDPAAVIERALRDGLGSSPRPILAVSAGDAGPRYGAIAVIGVAAGFLDAYHARPTGATSAALTLGRILGSVLVDGPLAREVFAPFEARLEIDGAPRTDRFTALAAGTVRHLGLGFAPFRTAGRSADRFHWIATRATGRRLALELPAIAAGAFPRRSCLEHASPRRVRVELRKPLRYTIDGDVFPAAPSFRIEAGPTVRFAVPVRPLPS